jgi:hypothetical protein
VGAAVLEEDFGAIATRDDDVDGAVEEAFEMHLTARRPAYHAVVLVDHGEEVAVVRTGVVGGIHGVPSSRSAGDRVGAGAPATRQNAPALGGQ